MPQLSEIDDVFQHFDCNDQVKTVFVDRRSFGAKWVVGMQIKTFFDQRQSGRARIAARPEIEQSDFLLQAREERGNELAFVIRRGFPDWNIVPAEYRRISLELIRVVYPGEKFRVTPIIQCRSEDESTFPTPVIWNGGAADRKGFLVLLSKQDLLKSREPIYGEGDPQHLHAIVSGLVMRSRCGALARMNSGWYQANSRFDHSCGIAIPDRQRCPRRV
jgi:hypothetical protein